jgi:hypothetical protein
MAYSGALSSVLAVVLIAVGTRERRPAVLVSPPLLRSWCRWSGTRSCG